MTEIAEVAARIAPKRLPFAFAKRFGVVVAIEEEGADTISEEGADTTKVVSAPSSSSSSSASASARYVVHCRESVTPQALREVRRVLGQAFSVQRHSNDDFEAILTQAYQRGSSEAKQLMEDIGNEPNLFSLADELPQTEDLLESEDDAPIIKLINAMLSEAIKEGASDIHIETFEKELLVRFRIDGVLREVIRPNRKLSSLLVSRIKVMAQLDIAEKRVPQDGRISLLIAGRAVDVRVSTMPSNHGERVVLRLLDKNNARLNLAQLGMTEANRKVFAELIKKPHGIILVTGPTGSGKSTTLYAGLAEINSRDRNILTVEDPIEYAIEGIGQMQVNPKVNMTFARGLRAILRQDPDVVMVGEIRDVETAQIGVQASLTGHLVMSTLHTNTASGAITRLEDMGIEPFLLSSSLLAVLSQRLVRTLCTHCREAYEPSAEELAMFDGAPVGTLHRAKGCDKCNHTGYRGRTGIHEVLVVDEKVRDLVHTGHGEQAIEKYIRQHTPSIRDDGLAKVAAGLTTLEEVLRVTREE
ncbi:type II secretion system ATPase GspE [Pseudidiomarina sp.]|uniref:type II secretion system ATPase GspE n=1 Tax=Pseudidiomarina sp. TaxID=2081707 RepID=UPI00299DF025|nr:type II secretion system ATPase GspE [Pseudidiomarina sp.]MDX1706526.1 type II secretion system ATPase GspE [Pseudidiomarina sp.]